MKLRKIVWTASLVVLIALLVSARRLVKANQAAMAGGISRETSAFYGH